MSEAIEVTVQTTPPVELRLKKLVYGDFMDAVQPIMSFIQAGIDMQEAYEKAIRGVSDGDPGVILNNIAKGVNRIRDHIISLFERSAEGWSREQLEKAISVEDHKALEAWITAFTEWANAHQPTEAESKN